ncbi:MAG: class F sortase [Bifidobacterium psychraerophilum]|uniref:class F sortase n=1 Tax=Bifidobacterium psychraerophilum TaxID=218140 RepID=UPI0039E9B306
MRRGASHSQRPRVGADTKRPLGLIVLAVVFVLMAALAVASLLMALLQQGSMSSEAGGAKDLAGNTVVLDDGQQPTKQQVAAMKPQQESGMRFTVPSVGLDVGMQSLSVVDGVIVPPGFRDAYLVRNLGVGLDQAKDGTVFVVMHSVQGGLAPGNYLTNVEQGSIKLAKGALIQVGERSYQVTGGELLPKSSLQDESRVWQNTPGRLVVITCLERVSGRSLQNAVIYATLQS